MKSFLCLFLCSLFLIACRKDEVIVTEPDTIDEVDLSDFFGDWNLIITEHANDWWSMDSLEVDQSPELLFTLTDSALPDKVDPEKSNLRFYYGKYYQEDEVIDLCWSYRGIRERSVADTVPDLFRKLSLRHFDENNCLLVFDMNSRKDLVLQKSNVPYIQDSVTYRVTFSQPPPNVGLMLGFTNSLGEFEIDTLRSGNWEWEKRALISTDVRDYRMEIVGATESFFEVIDSDYSAHITLKWSFESANGAHKGEVGIKHDIFSKFKTDGTVEFGESPIEAFRIKYMD